MKKYYRIFELLQDGRLVLATNGRFVTEREAIDYCTDNLHPGEFGFAIVPVVTY